MGEKMRFKKSIVGVGDGAVKMVECIPEDPSHTTMAWAIPEPAYDAIAERDAEIARLRERVGELEAATTASNPEDSP